VGSLWILIPDATPAIDAVRAAYTAEFEQGRRGHHGPKGAA
jgi:hypothetical protein